MLSSVFGMNSVLILKSFGRRKISLFCKNGMYLHLKMTLTTVRYIW